MRDDVGQSLRWIEAGEQPGAFGAGFRFDPALPVFQGHFPGNPVLPGVLQIELVRTAVERHTGRPWSIAKVSRVRFHNPVRPGDEIELQASLSPREGGELVKATVKVRGETAASLSMLLRPAEGP